MATNPTLFGVYNSSGTYGSTYASSQYNNIANGNWYHVAGTYDGSQVCLYIKWKSHKFQFFTGNIKTNSLPLGFGNIINRSDTEYYYGFYRTLMKSASPTLPARRRNQAGCARLPYSVYTSPVVDLTQVASWNDLSWLAKGCAPATEKRPISTTGLVAQWNFNETRGYCSFRWHL